jgi:RND family efflux transporter MFP subunit
MILVAVTVLGAAGYVAFQVGRQQVFATTVELGSVVLASPAHREVTLVASGYVFARKRAVVAPKVTGRLVRLRVVEGQVVESGQLLADLEDADPHARLAQVKADVATAEARIERARADLFDAEAKLQREEALSVRGAGTQSAVDDAQSRVIAMKAQLAASDAERRAVEARRQVVHVDLENTQVRAPFKATVVRKLAEVGEVVAPQGQGIVMLVALDELEVHVDVSESHYTEVALGAPAEVALDAFPAVRFRGKVTEVRQQVERAKAAITVKVAFTDPVSDVLPDMAAKVSFLRRPLDAGELSAKPKPMVPADAVVSRGGRSVVFVADLERVHVRGVKVVSPRGTDGLVELAEGPASGSRVVRRPPEALRDGTPIREKGK